MPTMTAASPDTRRTPLAGLVALSLAGRLLARFWPQLAALTLASAIAQNVLTEVAVRVGFWNHLAGLSTLTLVVLVDLVALVAMFETLRPGLPALDAASADAGGPAAEARPQGARRFAAALTLTLVPFFAYYAAWGFLGDAVRAYSKLALDLAPFGESGMLLDVSGGWWLFGSVAVAWIVRRAAKALKARTGRPVWDVVIVVCEANWAFIGLFVLSVWKDDATAFLATLPERLRELMSALDPVGPAAAASPAPPPVERAFPGVLASAQGLFFYALYPVVQLTLAALIYGYDVHGAEAPAEGPAARALARWRALPKALRDFAGHFIAGTLKRYRALANGVRLTLSAGVALIVTVVVGWRLLDWLAAWAWLGLANLIGPHTIEAWQVIAHGLSLLLGTPSAPGDGLLVSPIKICLLAAALETAFAAGGRFRRA